MKRKAVVIVLMLLICLVTVVPSMASSKFAGGSGSAFDPYVVKTFQQLKQICEYPNAHYRVACDIIVPEGEVWSPIPEFSGVFDGQGYTISGISVAKRKTAQTDLYGGFIAINRGMVQNLNLNACNVSVEKTAMASSGNLPYTGGIAGFNYGTIFNCTVNGSVSSTRHGYSGGISGVNEGMIESCTNYADVSAKGVKTSAGGICGKGGNLKNCSNFGKIFSDNGSAGGITGEGNNILYCSNLGDVESDYAIGGIAGKGGNISFCYNAGVISNVDRESTQYNAYIGGLVGINTGNVSDCYNVGNVFVFESNFFYGGGIAGWVNSGCLISRCYNLGVVSGGCLGGIVGLNEGIVTSCYYADHHLTGTGYGVSGAVRCNLGQMGKENTFDGFDFSSVWFIDPYYKRPYPQLRQIPMATITNVEVVEQAKNPECAINGTLDLSGAKIRISYSDGHKTTQDVTKNMLSQFSTNRPGVLHLTVSYGGISSQQKLTYFVLCNQHKYQNWVEVQAATCIQSGKKEKVCEICQFVQTETVAKLEHDFDVWNVTRIATCTQTGEKVRYCLHCFSQEKELIPRTSHSFLSPKIEQYPTCTTPGIMTGTCVTCGQATREKIKSTGHSYVEVQRFDATCTQKGLLTEECATCNIRKATEIPPLGHQIGVASEHSFLCSRCNQMLTDSSIDDSVSSDMSHDINSADSSDIPNEYDKTDVADLENSDLWGVLGSINSSSDGLPLKNIPSNLVCYSFLFLLISVLVVLMLFVSYQGDFKNAKKTKNRNDGYIEEMEDFEINTDVPFEIFGDE